MQLTHRDAEQRYSEFRAIALQSIQKNLPYPDKARIRLKLIDAAALSACKLWESDRTRKVIGHGLIVIQDIAIPIPSDLN